MTATLGLCACATAKSSNDADADSTPEPPPAQTDIGGIGVGQAAPDFELTSINGQSVSLASMRKDGPVVVVFYRGDWCPICRQQLTELAEAKPQFDARGASVVAVSVDAAEKNAALAERVGANFPLLADPDLATIRAYDVEHVGEDIARPSTYVIGRDGQVTWAWVGERAGDRPDLEHILAAIP